MQNTDIDIQALEEEFKKFNAKNYTNNGVCMYC